MTTLHESTTLGVGFVSLTEALDLTTPAGRAFAGFLAVFAEFKRDLIRERIKAGITDTRKQGKAHGRPRAHAMDKTTNTLEFIPDSTGFSNRPMGLRW
jgi:DNA invertase Pin-like site-specific DNA recombinase